MLKHTWKKIKIRGINSKSRKYEILLFTFCTSKKKNMFSIVLKDFTILLKK